VSVWARATPAQASGREAEDAAGEFLTAQGLRILARNYRTRLGEIDLIAWDRQTLVFVEVRLRREGGFGGALGSITARKRSRIAAAARRYLMRFRCAPPCRFDVVTLEGGSPAWLRGAFDVSEG
jgi:putative endonuclease